MHVIFSSETRTILHRRWLLCGWYPSDMLGLPLRTSNASVAKVTYLRKRTHTNSSERIPSIYMMLKETCRCSRTTSSCSWSTLLLRREALDALIKDQTLTINDAEVHTGTEGVRLTLLPINPDGDYYAGKPWSHWINVRDQSLPLASARGKASI